MRIRWIGTAALGLTVLFSARMSSALQAATPVATTNAKPVSGGLQAALDGLLQTAGSLKLEKWKGGTVRDEAAANLKSIQQDLQSTLPPMLTEADQAGGRLSAVLPVSRNVDALYDVLLRVVDGARIAGSADQVQALMQAQAALEKARRGLDAQIAETAAAQEKQVGDLQAALKAQAAAPVCPVAAPVETPAPAAKKHVKKKAAATAAPAKTPTTPPANGTAKPNP